MAYRYTNTDKWRDEWFIELKPLEKLMFMYLSDNCDTAGFYELSTRRLIADLHFTEGEVKQSLKGIEKAYVLSRDRHVLFLKNYCKHQKNIPLNPLNNAHIGIIKCVNEYQPKFAFDLIKIINKDAKTPINKVKNEGLRSPYGNGNVFNIDFFNFWSLYGKKVGNKSACEKKWNNLKHETQKKIISVLPDWKKQFTEIQYQPYAETFLNNKRWEDEIIIPEEKKIKAEFPDYYDKTFEGKLSPKDCGRYWVHLRDCGLVPKKDNQQTIVGWTKQI